MVNQGNVSTLTFGGQPSKDHIVAIGGTQGAQVQNARKLYNYALAAYNLALNGLVTATNAQVKSLQALLTFPLITIHGGLASARVNFLDNLLGDSETPLQFRQINSNCRTFYTADDINDISKTWSKVAGGNFTCVDGGSKPGTPKKNSGNSLSPSNISWVFAGALMSVILLI